MRVAIIGAGVAGLSAAYELSRTRDVSFTLFDKRDRAGGVIWTEKEDGCIFEAGPDSFLTEKPWAADLCRDLGIADQLTPSNDATRKTYILVRGRLVTIPDGLMFMVPTRIRPVLTTPLFSLGTKLRMGLEWFRRPRESAHDESVADFVARHYGAEMVDRLADPLLGGVYGGKASKLSIRAVLPRFVAMEEKYGSLAKPMLAARKQMAQRGPLFTTMRDGMRSLVDALMAKLPPNALRLGTEVAGLELENRRWRVRFGHTSEQFDAIILATPAYAAGNLLHAIAPELAAELNAIDYTSSITLGFGYDAADVSLPSGFGFLVPRSEGLKMLACTFVHQKFSGRAPADRALLRVFVPGGDAGENMKLSDNELLGSVRAELREVLGLSAAPRFARVFRWPRAMAQYTVGHLDRVQRIIALRDHLPGLALAGNAYSGIGVPDCIRTGRDAATSVVSADRLQTSRA
jgi:protoporphyrinogen/coproporphyrinogen III oxidase